VLNKITPHPHPEPHLVYKGLVVDLRFYAAVLPAEAIRKLAGVK
jgi:hypothetical protein